MANCSRSGSSIAKYMGQRRGPPSQGWKTFLRNHADGVAAMDLFVVPTISFRLLYGVLIMGHGRRQILWLGVTTHPMVEWLANQLTAARRIRSLGIRDHPTSVRSPWQNGCGAFDWLDSPGMYRCARSKGHSARRLYRSTAHTWWSAPSIRPDLICGRDRCS